MASYGCNLAAINKASSNRSMKSLPSWAEPLKDKGIYLLVNSGDQVLEEKAPTTEAEEGKEEEAAPASQTVDPALIDSGLLIQGSTGEQASEVSPDKPVTFQDVPLVTRLEANPLVRLIGQRVLGRPFLAQWGFAWPNEYLPETPLLYSAYAGLEGWSANLGGEMAGADGARPFPRIWTSIINPCC